MNRCVAALVSLALALTARPAAAAKELPPVDAFTSITPSLDEPGARDRARGLHVVHEEPRLGVPTFVWGVRPSTGARAVRPLPPEQAARAYLGEQAGLYRLARTDSAHIPVRDVHRTRSGASLVTFEQEVDGIEVFRQSLKVLMDADNQLISASGYLSPSASEPRFSGGRLRFTLGPREAIALAWRDLHGENLPTDSLLPTGRVNGRYNHYELSPGPRRTVFASPARVKQVFFPLPGALVPAYYVELDTSPADGTEAELYAYVISAEDGLLLFRNDLTAQESYTYRVWADAQSPHIPYDGPQGTAPTPHPTGLPDGYQATFVAPNLVTLSNVPFSRNDPWLPAGALETRGNNVEAYTDAVAPDGFTDGADLRASISAPGTFSHAYDLFLAPSVTDTQQMSAVTQLFFVTNFLHDWFYDSGFDEAAGNAQHDNYGRGGVEADSLRAEAQDSSGRNNANMSTPADGGRPRMQMYLYDTRGRRVMIVPPTHALEGTWAVGVATFGPQQYEVPAPVVIAEDGVAASDGGTVNDACEPLTNAAAVSGKFVLVDRPRCDFALKAANAQAAGAVGVIIANNVSGGASFVVTGRDSTITIPVVSVSYAMGNALRDSPPASVTLVRDATDRDGALDNTIVAHEWAHYLTNRLIGNANGLSNNQGRSMGEGWGDFMGLLMIAREGDDQVASNSGFGGVYARGAYANSGGNNQGFYWGNRRYPYSTDLTKNPLTLRHIQNGIPLPSGIPVQSGATGVNNAEVHNSGEVWSVMLWECYTALLRDTGRLTFSEAQQRMKDYLILSLKLTPNAPTFLEARDAVLAAAYANDPRDFLLFAQAFARRGAGTRAVVPDRTSTTHVGVTESFATGKDVALASVELLESTGTTASCDDDGVLDTGETARVRVTLRNSGTARLERTSMTLSSDDPDVSFPEGATVTFPAAEPVQLTTAELTVKLSGAATRRDLALRIAYRDEEQLVPGDQLHTVTYRVNTDELPGTSLLETVEAPHHPWTVAASPASLPLWTRQLDSTGANWFFRGPDNNVPGDLSFVSPPLQVSDTAAFRFTFQHRYVFERSSAGIHYDGAIIELSEDDGQTWVDIGTSVSPTYNATLDAAGDNPLGGKRAYGGQSPGYPAFAQATADLGTTYAGKTVRIRFHIGTDSGTGATGWDLDDLQLEGVVNTPFTALVAHRGVCINRTPVANAGPAQTVNERRQVTLSGSGTDPEGSTLTYEWTQATGTPVTLSDARAPNPTFLAPEVTQDTDFQFELRVRDGVNTSAPSVVTVRVRDISNGNRAPTVEATPVLEVLEKDTVTLVASGTDADEDAVSYQWTQVGTPAVVLEGATTAQARFIAPEVRETVELTFQVVASDGTDQSAPFTVTVRVNNVNHAPVASVAPVTAVDEGASVTLMGSATDVDEGTTLVYTWTQVGSPTVTLSDSASASPSFTAPQVDSDTELTFQLVASDGEAASEPVTVTVLVRDVPNAAPVARAGEDQSIVEGSEVTLNGSDSTDPESTALTYSWTQVEGPTVALSLAGPRATFNAPAVDEETALTFQLQVTDARGLSSTDTITVRVSNKPVTPPGNGSGCGCAAGQDGSTPTTVLLLLAALGFALRRPRWRLL
ncbi:myxosortase-dependent M36 family metallopeptidase [Archangium lansingense]|uniref:myxosortase-dependent M36 family metallopeptidase n=1 Tax=Archangium lansingense TaxID=2995310 RepID=UPI003B7B4BC1